MGNNHAGGAKGGLFMYVKAIIPSLVRNDDIPPMIKGIAIQIISVINVRKFHVL